VIWGAVDKNFGPSAVLGIPSLNASDRAVAEEIRASAGNVWRVIDRGPSSVRAAQRFASHDRLVSHSRAWGTPIPVIRCETCGIVGVPIEDLPVRLPTDVVGKGLDQNEEFIACSCPRCSGPARRETDTLTPEFDRLWQWIAPCVSREEGERIGDGSELSHWLPARGAIFGADDGASLSDQRASAKALRDCGVLSGLAEGEPFACVTMHNGVRQINPKERIHIDGLIKRSGADALRLALLFAAAPANVLPWSARTLQYCHGWLSSFWSYALPRLKALEDIPEVDDGEGAVALRGRLERWSAIAVERVTENFDGLRMHSAVRNVMRLLVRIEDFERRVLDQYGELTPADSKAIGETLIIAVQLLAPLAPHIAEELWSAAGADGLLVTATWPHR
jgi:leucyl-tRNA synthetase